MKKIRLKEIVDILQQNKQLKYGVIIDKTFIGDLIGCHDYDNGKYIYPLLELKAYIENEKGMYCKINCGNLQIFSLNTAGKCSKNRRKRADKIDSRNRNILKKIDTNHMTSSVKSEIILEKRLLEMKLRQSRLIMREIEYYEQ